MLTPSDIKLVRRDRALPGLAILLDPDMFLATLRHHRPGGDLEAAEITYVRYKPQTSCMVGYQLQIQGQMLDVYAQVYCPNATDKLLKSVAQPSVAGPLGPGRFMLEEPMIGISCFPNDERLKGLVPLADPGARQALLARMILEEPDLRTGRLQRLRYKPLRRYVARVQTDLDKGIVLKAYNKDDYQAAQVNAKALQSRGMLRLARRVGRSGRHHLLALEWLPGRLVEDVLAAPELEVEKVAAVGAALGELHSQQANKLTLLTHAAETKALFGIARWIAFTCPQLARRAYDLAQRMNALLSGGPVLDHPIHGDFYAAQVLLADDQVVILDLDQAGRGDPAVDLGTFIAHLESDAVRGHLNPGRVEPATLALLEGYRESTDKFMPLRLQLYTAARLFRLSPHPFRQRERYWPVKTEAILQRVAALLKPFAASAVVFVAGQYEAKARRAPGVVVSDPLGAAGDAQMPFLKHALSPLEAQPMLANNLPYLPGFTGQVSLQAIRVTRHKPGRRCVIEYDVQVQRQSTQAEMITLIGKAHARRLKRSIFGVLKSLWSAGFAADSEDYISIPEPVGMILEFHMWLQRKVGGEAAIRMLAGANGITLARRIAEAAHKIHQAGVPALRRHTITDEMDILGERLQFVSQEKPEWQNRLKQLLAACYRLASDIPFAPPTGIHRDFYPDQVLVNGARLYLLDFDLYCEGDPAVDIGNFLGHVQEHSLRSAGNAKDLADQEAALEERFIELSANSRAPAAVRLAVSAYTTLTLARHIYISSQFPARQPFSEALLDLCEQRLKLAQRPYDLRQTSSRR